MSTADCDPKTVAAELCDSLKSAPLHGKLKAQQEWFSRILARCGKAVVEYANLIATATIEMYDAGRADTPSMVLIYEANVTDNSKKIEIHGSVSGSIVGIDQMLENVQLQVQSVQNKILQGHLDALTRHVKKAIAKIDPATAKAAAEDLDTFVKEAAKPSPRRGILDLTRDGLVDAAKTVAEMAPPILATIALIYKALWP